MKDLIDRIKYAQKIEGERQVCLWLHERGICDKEICQFCRKEKEANGVPVDG